METQIEIAAILFPLDIPALQRYKLGELPRLLPGQPPSDYQLWYMFIANKITITI